MIATAVVLFTSKEHAHRAGFHGARARHHQSEEVIGWWPGRGADALRGFRPGLVVNLAETPAMHWSELEQFERAAAYLRQHLPVWIDA